MKGDIHGNKVLTQRSMETFIALLLHRITNKHASLCPGREFSLVSIMAMSIGYSHEHPKGNIIDETGGGVGFLEVV